SCANIRSRTYTMTFVASIRSIDARIDGDRAAASSTRLRSSGSGRRCGTGSVCASAGAASCSIPAITVARMRRRVDGMGRMASKMHATRRDGAGDAKSGLFSRERPWTSDICVCNGDMTYMNVEIAGKGPEIDRTEMFDILLEPTGM